MAIRPKPIPYTQEDEDAYRRLLARGYTKMQLAAICGISKQAVTRWKAIPVNYVHRISEATGISKRSLRPSFF